MRISCLTILKVKQKLEINPETFKKNGLMLVAKQNFVQLHHILYEQLCGSVKIKTAS